MQNKKEDIKHLLFFCLHFILISSNAQYIVNGDFNNDTVDRAVIPLHWGVCDESSTPDIRSEYEYENSSGILDIIYSLDNTNFARLRTRGIYYTGRHIPGSAEGMFTKLIRPLESGYCYRIGVDLANAYDERSVYPLRFQLWGSNDSCIRNELLFESTAINSTVFERYNFSFELKTQEYEYIYVIPGWDTVNYAPFRYDGFIFIDNLSITQLKPINRIFYDTVYFTVDPIKQLHALPGDAYIWDQPVDVLSSIYVQSPLMLDYTDDLTVNLADRDGCPMKEKIHVILNCDSLYEKTFQKEEEIYFHYDSIIRLEATKGKNYIWDPIINLSPDTGQNPVFNGYEDYFAERLEYNVTITDKYDCPYMEKYTVIRDCDTLYPNNEPVVVLDTFTNKLPEIQFHANGTPTGPWITDDLSTLSCLDCVDPKATPFSSQTYTIYLEDPLFCPRQEIYRIQVGLTIPNFISPNNDGYNDEFIVPGLPPGSTVYIYKKDGVLVYSHENYGYETNEMGNKWWRGSFLGKTEKVSTGTYWYVLDIKKMNKVEKGYIFVKE